MLGALHEGLTHCHLMPSLRHTGLIHAAAELVHKQWTVMAAANVFFPRPNDLHRYRLTHSCFYRLNGVVRGFTRAAPEAASHERSVNGDVLLRDSQKMRDHFLVVGLVLGTAPDRAGVAFNLSNAVHGLQSGMSQQRHLVCGLDHAPARIRRFERTDSIADILRQQTRGIGQGTIIRIELLTGDPVIHTAVPFDLEFGARLLRPPVAIR